MKGIGSNEQKVINEIVYHTNAQRLEIASAYRTMYDKVGYKPIIILT